MKSILGDMGRMSRALYLMGGGCLVLSLLFCVLNGGTAHGERKFFVFFRPEFQTAVFLTALGCTALLWILMIISDARKAVQADEVGKAVAKIMVLYPAALVLLVVLSIPRLCCNWEVEQYIRGSDKRMYYVLHAPPPMNGAGHSALARGILSTPTCYVMQIISDDYLGARNRDVVIAGLDDPDPDTQTTCRMLLATLKARDAADRKRTAGKRRGPGE